MRRLTLALIASLCAALPASAFVTAPCGPEFTPLTITEPWEDNSRVFANGAIRVFEMFISPTVASGAALGILHPLPDGPGGPFRACTAIYSGTVFRYFGQAFVAEATAVYDPALGLVISVPVGFTDGAARQVVTFAVNQATGIVTLR